MSTNKISKASTSTPPPGSTLLTTATYGGRQSAPGWRPMKKPGLNNMKQKDSSGNGKPLPSQHHQKQPIPVAPAVVSAIPGLTSTAIEDARPNLQTSRQEIHGLRRLQCR